MNKVNLLELIKEVEEPWHRIDVCTINNSILRIAKIEGEFRWHTHQSKDECFLVLKGKIFIDTNKEGTIELNEMESYIVKKGTRHRSRADEPAWVLLIDPAKAKGK
ncbi:MAG: cupin domain-containing protein [Candidatus Aminicenantes bacterium]|nr:cupin domain-containing protein [Candidatus Aminicenantes bacterium]